MIWATGFDTDHSWIEVLVFDPAGRILHDRGVAAALGLYFLGLPWLYTRGSALLGWVKDDAEHLAGCVASIATALASSRHTPNPAQVSRKATRMKNKHNPPIDSLIVSGLTELALGALTGWPMAIAVSRPQDLPKIGIRSGARLRQWHLDLIMLGSMTAAASRFIPDPPRKVAVPLAVGAWVNANAFGVLALRPTLKEHPIYKTGVAASFISTSWGFLGLAAVAWKRWLRAR